MRLLKQRSPASPSSTLAATLTGHGRVVNVVEFSPNGQLLASAGGDRKVILWDVDDPAHSAQVATLTQPRLGASRRWRIGDLAIRAVGFSPNGQLLASGSSRRKTVILWDVTDPARPDLLATLTHPHPDRRNLDPEAGVNAVAFSPDGRLLACGCNKTVVLWDVTAPARPVQLASAAHRGWVKAARFSPDGRLLATGAVDGKNPAILWNVADPQRPERIAVIQPQRRDWARIMIELSASTVRAVAFSPNGQLLATGGGSLVGGQYVTGSSGFIALWDVTDPAHPVRTADPSGRLGGQVYAVAFSPDGRSLAVGSEQPTVTLWDVADPTHSAALTGHRGDLRAVAFSPDGRLLASCGTDKAVRLWDLG